MLSRWLFPVLASSACWLARAAETNRPPVHMLVPGFTVQELPIKLSNQNNLRFAPDGSLTSLGYDGKVWRLRDTNGDGLEDTAEPFWDQPTLSVPLGMAWSTHGLYVSSKGKVSLLRDTNADGRADTEEVIASGWPATNVGSGGVDATAVTLDQDGNVFFGLLVADYANAYRLRKVKDLRPDERAWLARRAATNQPGHGSFDLGNSEAEVSLYDLNSKRGTIQRFDPRTKQVTTFATGLRVPVALAFNREGDLFNTDQEGETWMPNGNPLDELNHIIAGRNYGFPPRHERWLPGTASRWLRPTAPERLRTGVQRTAGSRRREEADCQEGGSASSRRRLRSPAPRLPRPRTLRSQVVGGRRLRGRRIAARSGACAS